MDEVEVGAVRDSVEERMVPGPLDLVPADVRERRRLDELGSPAGKDPERRGVILVAAVEQKLQAETDTEEWLVTAGPGANRSREPGCIEPCHRRSRRADSRDDKAVRVRQGVRVGSNDDVGTDRRERLVDRDEVARAVIDDGDPGSRGPHHPSEPLVDATPSRRGSISQATRSARPSALNAASAR